MKKFIKSIILLNFLKENKETFLGTFHRCDVVLKKIIINYDSIILKFYKNNKKLNTSIFTMELLFLFNFTISADVFIVKEEDHYLSIKIKKK